MGLSVGRVVRTLAYAMRVVCDARGCFLHGLMALQLQVHLPLRRQYFKHQSSSNELNLVHIASRIGFLQMIAV
jgi:hypothetical protein